jgi:Flp pilus assembly protein TadG
LLSARGIFLMPSPAASTAPLRKALRRFRRNRTGSAAVEFALIAPVFFALLFAIVETGIIFFANQVLETIAQDSARSIMTGQAQAAAYSQSSFFTQVVCPANSLALVLFNNCTNLYVDVESYPSGSFTSVPSPLPSQIDAGKNFINNMVYLPGGPGDIVVVRMFYAWPQIVTGLGYNITNLTGNKRLLYATAAFRNEPF